MNCSTEAIRQRLEGFPRAGLPIEPTPIHHLPRLSRRLHRSIHIMRDDLIGFGIGGNKVRKLDFLIGDALARKADTLLTSVASSFSRNAAMAGRARGFEVHVVLAGTATEHNRASRDLFRRAGAILHYVPQPGEEMLGRKLEQVLGSLEAAGKSVYLLHPGGSDRIGCLGYVRAFNQIVQYTLETGIHFSHIVHSTGSAGTQAGLVLGQCIAGYDTTITGMAASQKTGVQHLRVVRLARETAAMLNVELEESRVIVDDRFLGPGYARPSAQGEEASGIFTATEGILLDDSYTAKAAAGLIHHAAHGAFAEQDKILFINTSGDAGTYY